MTEVNVVRVFTNEAGEHGNPLGIVLDTAEMPAGERQAIAARLSFSETVFIDHVSAARLHIHTPALEIPLAGHPLVGSAWFLSQHTGSEVKVLRPVLAAEVESWQDVGLSWVRASVADAPDWQFVQLASGAEVEALSVPPAPEYDLHEFWAWEDEASGRLRARVFGSRYGVPEDEATGSGALRLTGLLQRPLTIHQGKGSVVYARPAGNGRAEIGGRVVADGTRVI
jgi:predicted PhzF superfamily epimerase YddE/YHI9